MNEPPGRITQGTTEAFVERLYAEAAAGRFGVRPFGKITLVDEPETIHEVLRSTDTLCKDYGVVSRLGQSRINADGEEWRIRQGLTQPQYNAAARPDQRRPVGLAYVNAIARIGADNAADLPRALLSAACSVFHGALGCAFGEDEAIRLIEALRRITAAQQRAGLFAAPPHALEAISRQIAAFYAEMGAYAEANDSFASMLHRMRDAAAGIPNFRAAEEYAFNVAAGVETSASAIGWVIDRLGAMPDLQEACAAEIASGGDRMLTERVIDEALRRFPPVPFLVRVAMVDTELGGTMIPAGRRLLVSIVGAHHHPDYWDRPFDFDPYRSELTQPGSDNAAFVPFSAGRRMCGGKRIARIEASEAAAAVLSRFHIVRKAVPLRFKVALVMRPDTWDDIGLSLRDK